MRLDLSRGHCCCCRFTPLCADLAAIAERMSKVKNKLLVLSGKGGVGKSTFATQLAFALAAQGKEVRGHCMKGVMMTVCGV